MTQKISISLQGRVFTVACDDGQEKRVQYLAQYIDQKLRDVTRAGGANNNESYQWLLACLIIADELLTAREQLDAVQMDTKQVDTKTQRQNDVDFEAVQHLTQRLEELAEKLNAAV